jgi:hypothetical protein
MCVYLCMLYKWHRQPVHPCHSGRSVSVCMYVVHIRGRAIYVVAAAAASDVYIRFSVCR